MPSTRAPRGKSYPKFLELYALETDECVLWPYGLNGYGYGKVWVGTRHSPTHRLSCEMAYGPPPTPLHTDAAHTCHTRACLNPRHLRWATRKENMLDKRRDGTHPQGERHGMCKLTENDVREIRRQVADGTMQSVLADQYKMSRAAVCLIVSGKNWSHVV